MEIQPIPSKLANETVIREHYLHRRTSISFAYGLFEGEQMVGVVTFGAPASRAPQKSACPSDPNLVIELNRLWVHDKMPANTESWFVSRALKELPPRIVISYADTKEMHFGYIYRALNFKYAGFTTPRTDPAPTREGAHPRHTDCKTATARVPRSIKVRYWTVTGNRTERKVLTGLCPWPSYDWKDKVPPGEGEQPQAESPREGAATGHDPHPEQLNLWGELPGESTTHHVA